MATWETRFAILENELKYKNSTNESILHQELLELNRIYLSKLQAKRLNDEIDLRRSNERSKMLMTQQYEIAFLEHEICEIDKIEYSFKKLDLPVNILTTDHNTILKALDDEEIRRQSLMVSVQELEKVKADLLSEITTKKNKVGSINKKFIDLKALVEDMGKDFNDHTILL